MNIDIKRNAVVYTVVLSGLLVAADPVLQSSLVISSTTSSTFTQRVYPAGYAAGVFNCQAEYIGRHFRPLEEFNPTCNIFPGSFEYSDWNRDYILTSPKSKSSITIVPVSSSSAAISASSTVATAAHSPTRASPSASLPLTITRAKIAIQGAASSAFPPSRGDLSEEGIRMSVAMALFFVIPFLAFLKALVTDGEKKGIVGIPQTHATGLSGTVGEMEEMVQVQLQSDRSASRRPVKPSMNIDAVRDGDDIPRGYYSTRYPRSTRGIRPTMTGISENRGTEQDGGKPVSVHVTEGSLTSTSPIGFTIDSWFMRWLRRGIPIKRLWDLVFPTGATKSWGKKGHAVHVSWTCRCGSTFTEEIRELRAGAAMKWANQMNNDHQLLSPTSLVPSKSWSNRVWNFFGSRQGLKALRTPRQGDSTASRVQVEARGALQSTSQKEASVEYVLLCIKATASSTRLVHVNITEKTTDEEMFQALQDHYLAARGWYRKLMSLKKLQRIEFVRFRIYHCNNVAIGKGDIGGMPPSQDPEYVYQPKPPDDDPIIPYKALLHFFHHPSHAGSKSFHRARMVKKVKGQLILGPDAGLRAGWGIRFKEKVNWSRVFAVEGVICVVGVGGGLAWWLEKGDIQGGMSITACALGLGTVLLGLVHGLSENMGGSRAGAEGG